MTAEVGSFAKAVPHPWGLCDMTGNVWEWCDNHYGENLGDHRVMRGGAWNTDPEYCRAAYRKNYSPNERHFLYGFRVCFKEK
jgi:formylglycine-generating enzyme required for sulfatase activity